MDDFGQSLVQLQYTRLINPAISWVSTLYYGRAGGDFPAGFFAPEVSPDGADTTETLHPRSTIRCPNDHYGLMSYANYVSPNDHLELTGGVHAYTFRRENIEAIIPNNANPYYQDESRKDELSAFGKASYRWNDFLLFGDVQIRSVLLQLTPDETFFGATGPRS